jgi:hypothetical protein
MLGTFRVRSLFWPDVRNWAQETCYATDYTRKTGTEKPGYRGNLVLGFWGNLGCLGAVIDGNLRFPGYRGNPAPIQITPGRCLRLTTLKSEKCPSSIRMALDFMQKLQPGWSCGLPACLHLQEQWAEKNNAEGPEVFR